MYRDVTSHADKLKSRIPFKSHIERVLCLIPVKVHLRGLARSNSQLCIVSQLDHFTVAVHCWGSALAYTLLRLHASVHCVVVAEV